MNPAPQLSKLQMRMLAEIPYGNFVSSNLERLRRTRALASHFIPPRQL